MEINEREYRKGNLRWAIQRKRTIEGTQDTRRRQTKHKHITNVVDTTMHKQTQYTNVHRQ